MNYFLDLELFLKDRKNGFVNPCLFTIQNQTVYECVRMAVYLPKHIIDKI